MAHLKGQVINVTIPAIRSCKVRSRRVLVALFSGICACQAQMPANMATTDVARGGSPAAEKTILCPEGVAIAGGVQVEKMPSVHNGQRRQWVRHVSAACKSLCD